MRAVVTGVKIFFLIVVWASWAVLGTGYWIGLVARALAVFAFAFLYAMFTGQVVPAIHNNLVDLTDLWFREFRTAYESLFSNVKNAPLEVRNERLVIEIVWATIFWLLTFATVLALRGKFLPSIAHYATDIGGFIANVLTAIASIGWGWGTLVTAVIALLAFATGTMVAFSAADRRRRAEAERHNPSIAHQGAKSSREAKRGDA